MLIPNKFNGFHNGVRRCFGGGGGGGGGAGGDGGTGDAASAAGGGVGPGASGTGNGTGDGGGGGGSGPGGDGPNYVYTPTYTNTNTNANANFGNSNNTNIYSGPGVSTPQGMATLSAMKGVPWGQSGSAYNELLNQGFSSDQIRHSASSMYGAPSESNWSSMVQNAGMNSPTGRPMAGSDQFYQPVYNTSYQNYARPSTQFDVSTYGTQPMNSPAFNSGMSRGNINKSIENFYATNPMGRNADISNTLNFMRDSGVNREDFQSWAGKNNYGPQMSMPSMQTQQPFNPYANSSGYGGGFGGGLGNLFGGGFGGGSGGGYPDGLYRTQTQSPFSYQQSSYQPQMQNPFMQQQPSYGGYGGISNLMPQMQNPYMSQQQYSQPSMAYSPMSNPYTPQANLYNYQPQNYQPSYQSSYGSGYDDSGYNYQQPTPPPPTPQRTSSGPTTPIVGRSAGFRGTPNVMRRAEGGITSLMDDVE